MTGSACRWLGAARRRASGRGHLLVLACEVGGRWNEVALEAVRLLARAKAEQAPALLRVDYQRVLDESIITPAMLPAYHCADDVPELMDVLAADDTSPKSPRVMTGVPCWRP